METVYSWSRLCILAGKEAIVRRRGIIGCDSFWGHMYVIGKCNLVAVYGTSHDENFFVFFQANVWRSVLGHNVLSLVVSYIMFLIPLYLWSSGLALIMISLSFTLSESQFTQFSLKSCKFILLHSVIILLLKLLIVWTLCYIVKQLFCGRFPLEISLNWLNAVTLYACHMLVMLWFFFLNWILTAACWFVILCKDKIIDITDRYQSSSESRSLEHLLFMLRQFYVFPLSEKWFKPQKSFQFLIKPHRNMFEMSANIFFSFFFFLVVQICWLNTPAVKLILNMYWNLVFISFKQ